LLDEVLVELGVLLLQTLQVIPLVGIKEVHEIEQLPDVVVERSLRTRNELAP
jgi:hypothetical protein